MTWARKHCGSLSFIDGQSEGTLRTNLRIANNLTMDSIRWLITIVANERTERRAAALELEEPFNETTKGAVEVVCSSSDVLRPKPLLDAQLKRSEEGKRLFRGTILRRIFHYRQRTKSKQLAKAKKNGDDALNAESTVWKDWMNNANTTSKMTHTMLM